LQKEKGITKKKTGVKFDRDKPNENEIWKNSRNESWKKIQLKKLEPDLNY
jgi:hypothetical protein